MTARVYRLKVTYPEMPAPGWVQMGESHWGGWEPEDWESDDRCTWGKDWETGADECTPFSWPGLRNFLSRSAAERRKKLFEKYGATVVIEASEPVVWVGEQ